MLLQRLPTDTVKISNYQFSIFKFTPTPNFGVGARILIETANLGH